MNELESFVLSLDSLFRALEAEHADDCQCWRCVDEALAQVVEDTATMQNEIKGSWY